jgi:hypothetical protein
MDLICGFFGRQHLSLRFDLVYRDGSRFSLSEKIYKDLDASENDQLYLQDIAEDSESNLGLRLCGVWALALYSPSDFADFFLVVLKKSATDKWSV